MSLTPGKRLEFERDLFANHTPIYIRKAERRRGANLLRFFIGVLVLAGIAGISLAITSAAGFFSGEKRSIERMTRTFISGLAKGDGAGALQACAEGEQGRQLIQAEEREVFGQAAAASPEDMEQQSGVLRGLRTELDRVGVDWSDAKPIAFSGVRARIESEGMKRPLTVLAGNMYFTSGPRTFSVEVSAWRCAGEYVVVDVWKGGAVEGVMESPDDYSEDHPATPFGEDGTAGNVTFSKKLYVSF